MPDFFVVQAPGGEKLFVNLACVSDAWFGGAGHAPEEIRKKLPDEERVFVIYMRQLLSPERTQNYFWWSGLDAEVVQQEFLKAVRNPQPLHLALLPANS